MTDSPLRSSGIWRPEDRAQEQLREIVLPPLTGRDAPAGIVVELSYDRAGQAVLDLGLRAPDGQVGWSGGSRARIVVTDEFSTPGYPIVTRTDGGWTVLLGLHRIAADGTEYRLHARAATAQDIAAERSAQPPDPPVPPRPPRRELPSEPGLTWLAADFHLHTLHSDGALSIAQLAELAVRRGLAVAAVTDHNTVSHHRHLPGVGERYGIHLVPGQEITTDLGHANAYGDIGWVDFTAPVAQWWTTVAARGGIFSVNHPLGGDCSWRQALPDPLEFVEVWHSSWEILINWGGPLSWWLASNPRAVPLGGSDFHHAGADGLPGAPTTWVACADPAGSDALDAIRAGRTAVSAGTDSPVLLRVGDELVAVDAQGLYLTCPQRPRRLVTSPRQRFAGPGNAIDRGPWWLEGPQMEMIALCR